MALSVIRFDLRAPARRSRDAHHAYASAVEMASVADASGFDTIVLSEHHGAGDAYLPSPIALAAAMAVRTDHIPLTIAGLVVPLHDPVRLAEDIAVVDLLSAGRVSVVAELGDRPSEYWLFERDWQSRHQRMDECLQLLRQAWSGEPFERGGDWVQVTPRPYQDPHPMLFLGGRDVDTAERAARLGLGLYLYRDDPDLVQVYRDACERRGRRAGFVIVAPPGAVVFVAEDPDRAWHEIGEHLLFDLQETRRFQASDPHSDGRPPPGTVAELRADGRYVILTPEQCRDLRDEVGPTGTITLHPLCGGIPPAWAWTSLELYAEHVLSAR